MDPVRRRVNEFLGGFATQASVRPGPSASDAPLGGEAIADAVRELLAEDAATAGLELRVCVRSGVVLLRGRVRDLDDAENAEDVARRAPGVREVREELEVETLE